MPIQVNCDCGKSLKVKDELAGKAVKCPGCAKVIRVGAPVANQPAKQPPPQQTATRPTPPAAGSEMDDLFDEAGFSSHVAAICPSCRSEMAAGAVFCTKCGYNAQTGEQVQRHMTAGVDVDHGTLALEKAEKDIQRAAKIQKEMLTKSGMPWWMLFLILFMIGSGTTLAVLTVNASRRVNQDMGFDPVATFFVLAGSAFAMIAQGASIMIVIHAFKQDMTKGLLTVFAPFYIFYYVYKNWQETWRFMALAIVLGIVAGTLLAIGANRLQNPPPPSAPAALINTITS